MIQVSKNLDNFQFKIEFILFVTAVSDVIVTKNSSELLYELSKISPYDGGDCPELAIQGLINALEASLPNSVAYVFTDASAKDFDKKDIAIDLVQKKQITVNFLVTGHCGHINLPEFKVYEEISRASGGQVFNMKSNEIKEVLEQITEILNLDLVSIDSFDYGAGEESISPITVDSTYKNISVIITGVNPKMLIKNEDDEIVDFTIEFENSNMKYVTFKAEDLKYFIAAFAGSEYSIRVVGNSDLKMAFGFSLEKPNGRSETLTQPFDNIENYLSIFVSNPELIRCMTNVYLRPVREGDFEEIDLGFTKRGNYSYITKPIIIPNHLFYIVIHGYDIKGNHIERIFKIGIEPIKEIEIIHKYPELKVSQYSKFEIRCKYHSISEATATWYFRDEPTNITQTTPSSGDLYLTIDSFNAANVGYYKCVVNNNRGIIEAAELFQMRYQPRVSINSPVRHIYLNEEEKSQLQCLVNSFGDEYQLKWKNDRGKIFKSVSKLSERTYIDTIDINGSEDYDMTIYCEVKDEYFTVSDYVKVQVNFTLKESANITSFMRGVDNLNNTIVVCEASGSPRPDIYLYYVDKNGTSIEINDGLDSVISAFRSSTGEYDIKFEAHFNSTFNSINADKLVCEVKNEYGYDQRKFDTKDCNKDDRNSDESSGKFKWAYFETGEVSMNEILKYFPGGFPFVRNSNVTTPLSSSLESSESSESAESSKEVEVKSKFSKVMSENSEVFHQ